MGYLSDSFPSGFSRVYNLYSIGVLTIQKFPEEDRKQILYAIDAMIRDTKARWLAYS
jgi:hypothetical protein